MTLTERTTKETLKRINWDLIPDHIQDDVIAALGDWIPQITSKPYGDELHAMQDRERLMNPAWSKAIKDARVPSPTQDPTPREGLYGKYYLRKSNGKPLDPNARYFIMNYGVDNDGRPFDVAAQLAVLYYSDLIREGRLPTIPKNTQLAEDIRADLQDAGGVQDGATPTPRKVQLPPNNDLERLRGAAVRFQVRGEWNPAIVRDWSKSSDGAMTLLVQSPNNAQNAFDWDQGYGATGIFYNPMFGTLYHDDEQAQEGPQDGPSGAEGSGVVSKPTPIPNAPRKVRQTDRVKVWTAVRWLGKGGASWDTGHIEGRTRNRVQITVEADGAGAERIPFLITVEGDYWVPQKGYLFYAEDEGGQE